MSVDIILASLVEYLNANSEHKSGNIEYSEVIEARKRFSQSFNEYVDHRVQAGITKRRSQQSQQRIDLAQTINSAMKGTQMKFSTIRALSSAPPPPTSKKPEDLKKWQEEYDKWYNDERAKGLDIP